MPVLENEAARMNPHWKRVLTRTIVVGVILAVIGYLFGQAFLMMERMYAGDGYNVENERVLWQTPLVMACLGMVLTGGVDTLLLVFRKPASVSTSVPPSPGNGS